MEPIYKIIVDGNDITNKIRDGDKNLLESLNVTDRIGMVSDSCDFTLVFDGSYRIPPTKGKVEISIGYEAVIPENPQIQYGIWKVGTFIVEGVNFESSKGSGKKLQVNATSMPQSPTSAVKSLQNSNTRFWQSFAVDGTTFEDIVFQVCNEAELKADIHADLAKIKMPFTAQIGETDAEFLTKISSIRDGKVKYNDDQVIITLKDKSRLPEITIDANEKDIIAYGYSTSSRNDIRSVEATYKDSNNKIITVVEGKGEPKYIIENIQPDEQVAKDSARTLLAHAQRGQIMVSVSIASQPNLHAESPISLVNFDEPEVNGKYICEEVRHQLNKGSGLLSTISAQKQAEV